MVAHRSVGWEETAMIEVVSDKAKETAVKTLKGLLAYLPRIWSEFRARWRIKAFRFIPKNVCPRCTYGPSYCWESDGREGVRYGKEFRC